MVNQRKIHQKIDNSLHQRTERMWKNKVMLQSNILRKKI